MAGEKGKRMALIKQRLDELETYIPGKPISEIQKKYSLKEVIKLASNEWPYGPFPAAARAIKDNIDILNRYPDGEVKALRLALSKKMDLSTGNILIGNGSNELVKNMSEIILREDDEVLYCSPTFMLYKIFACVNGAKAVELPLKNHTFDLEAILKAINKKTKMIIICNPNNPTGTIVKQDELDDFVTEASKNELLIMVDEAYKDFVEDTDYPETVKYVKQGLPVVVLRTFSKIYGLAGLRIGYGVAPEELVTVDKKIRAPFNVNLLAQSAALESLMHPEEIKKRFKINLSNKKRMYKLFEELNLNYVFSEANFVLVDVKRDSRQVFEALLREGVIVRTGDIFGQDYTNYCRISVGTESEIDVLEKALRKVI